MIQCIGRFPRQQGTSLVEIMIAMAIGMFMAGVIASLYLATRNNFRYQEDLARLQESARFAINVLSRDIRMAGYNGCGSTITETTNVINGATTNPFLDFSTPVRGYEGGIDTFPSGLTSAGVISGTDAIVLIGVDPTSELVVQSHNPVSAQINTNSHSVKAGEILLITDCSKAAVFQMTGPSTANPTNVVHNTGTGTPGNCYKELGASCSSGAKAYNFKPGSSLMRVYSNAYYIGAASSGSGNSLWTLSLSGSTSGSSVARELIQGVENMQIAYGLDISPVDGAADKFVTADQVGSSEWSKVVSVRFSLLMTSSRSDIASTTQKYFYGVTAGSTAEAEQTPTDKSLRKVFSTTVAIRNRTM